MFLLLVDCALKATVLLMLAWGAQRALERASAAARHLMWALTLAGVLLLPALSALLPGWRVLPRWYETAGVVAAPQAVPAGPVLVNDPAAEAEPMTAGHDAPAAMPAAAPAPVVAWPGWPAVLNGVYVLGLLTALAPVGFGYVMLWRLRRRSTVLRGEEWMGLLRELAARMHVGRPVRLLSSTRQTMPVTWGILRPVILLPAAAEAWSEERRRCVLLHELAHIKRVDALGFLAARLVCAVYWFHPLAWLAAARLRAASELACDDLVLSAGTKSSTYAAELVTIAESAAGRLSGAAIAMARPNRPSQLHRRVLAVLDRTRNRRRLTVTVVAGCLAGVAGLVLPLAMLRGQLQAGVPSSVAAPTATTTSDNASVIASMPGTPAPASAPAAGGTLVKFQITKVPASVRMIQITVDSSKLQAYGLSAADVRLALEARNLKISPGTGQNPRDPVFQVDETAGDPGALGDVILKAINGIPVRLRDVAAISRVPAPATQPDSASATRAAAPRLQFRLVVKDGDTTTPADDLADPGNPGETLRVAREIVVNESGLAGVPRLVADPASGGYALMFKLTAPAAVNMGTATQSHRGQKLAVVVDGKVIAAPIIQSTITDSGVITFGAKVSKAQVYREAGIIIGLAVRAPVLMPEQSDALPEPATPYYLYGDRIYKTREPAPAEFGPSVAWGWANEFVYRTGLSKQYRLPSASVSPDARGFVVTFSSSTGGADLKVLFDKDSGKVMRVGERAASEPAGTTRPATVPNSVPQRLPPVTMWDGIER